MKKKAALAAAAAALFLAGCGLPAASSGGSSAPAEQEAASGQGAGESLPAEDALPTAEALGREETAELRFLLEGEEETAAADLWVGDGYSIYIPREGWSFSSVEEGGVRTDSWVSAYNDAVRLEVVCLGGRTLEEAQAWLRGLDESVGWVEDQQGGLFAEDAAGQLREAAFCPAGQEMYAVRLEYPLEAAEGFGVRLRVLADTFMPYEK